MPNSTSGTGASLLSDAVESGRGSLCEMMGCVSECVRGRPSGASRELEALVERGVAAHRRRHEKTVALVENPLDVRRVDVGMADRHVVLLAGLHHPRHPFQHGRMLVL